MLDFRRSFTEPTDAAHLIAASCRPALDQLARLSASFAAQAVLGCGGGAGRLCVAAGLGAGASGGSHPQGSSKQAGGWFK